MIMLKDALALGRWPLFAIGLNTTVEAAAGKVVPPLA
jgi:hypothetical protein